MAALLCGDALCGMRGELIASQVGAPQTAPPWGKLAAMELFRGEITRQVPLGMSRDSAAWPFWYMDRVPDMPCDAGVRQFLLIVAGGHSVADSTLGDHAVAFALP